MELHISVAEGGLSFLNCLHASSGAAMKPIITTAILHRSDLTTAIVTEGRTALAGTGFVLNCRDMPRQWQSPYQVGSIDGVGRVSCNLRP